MPNWNFRSIQSLKIEMTWRPPKIGLYFKCRYAIGGSRYKTYLILQAVKDIAPVTLLDVEMKSMAVFLFASILDLLAMERSIAVHLTHLTGSGEMLKKKRGVSSVNWDPVCIRDWVVSCVKVSKSRIKSDLLEPCIWLINILNKDCWLFITPISPGPFSNTSTVTTRKFSLKTIE